MNIGSDSIIQWFTKIIWQTIVHFITSIFSQTDYIFFKYREKLFPVQ